MVSRPRGWLTLGVLTLAVAILALGPGMIRDTLGGVFFARPRAGTATVAPRVDAALQADLAAIGASLDRGRLAASVTDLKSGKSAALDAERAYPSASLFKLPILVAVLAEEDAGRLDPNRLLAIRDEDWTDGSGVLQARIGDHLSVRELSRLMIQESDNIAALVLLDLLGVARVNASMSELGLHATHLLDRRAGDTGDHTTSAADMGTLLRLLASGAAVNQRVSEAALQVLELKQRISWLGEGLPFWVRVAHKWGDLPEARNDAGVIYTPRGSYVAVVLTEGAEPEAAAEAIGRVSRLMYGRL